MSRIKKSPYKILVCIVEKNREDLAQEILKNSNEISGISSIVDGTSNLGAVNNIMGLSKSQKVMISTFIRAEHAERTIQALDLVLCPDGKSYGVAFTVNLSSIARESYNYILAKKVVE